MIDFNDLIPSSPKQGLIDFNDLIPTSQAVSVQEGIEPTTEDLEKYRRMGLKQYTSPSGKRYPLTQPIQQTSVRPAAGPEALPIPEIADPNKPLAFVEDIIPPVGIPEIADPQDISPLRRKSQVKPIGLQESIKREGAWGVTRRLPFVGPSFEAMKNVEIANAAKRLQANTYEQMYAQPREKWTMQMIVNPHPSHLRREDEGLVTDHFDKLEEESRRDRTFWAKVGSGALDLAPWMIEFAATGGLSNLGSGTTRKFGEKLIGQYAKTKAGQLALRSAGWLGGAAARTTVGLPHRVAEQYTKRRLPEQLTIGEQGQVGFQWPKEKPFTSFAKAWGNVFVEAASEEAGATITKGLVKGIGKMPFGSRFLTALRKAWTKLSPDNSMMKFWQKIFTRGGYSNLIGEIGEERLATIMHSIAKTEDFGVGKDANVIDRLAAGFTQDVKNFPVEATVLSIPGATRFALGKATGRKEPPQEPPELRTGPEAKITPTVAKDPDKYREDLNKKWGEEKFDKVWFELAEGGENERFSDIDARVAELDEAGRWNDPETKRLRIEMDSIVDAELEKRKISPEDLKPLKSYHAEVELPNKEKAAFSYQYIEYPKTGQHEYGFNFHSKTIGNPDTGIIHHSAKATEVDAAGGPIEYAKKWAAKRYAEVQGVSIKPWAEPIERPGEVTKRRRVDILPRKTEIIAGIDEAIEKAPEVKDYDSTEKRTVHFEINGGANIQNNKEALLQFRQRVAKLPETELWPKAATHKVGKKKPIAATKEKVGELLKAPEGWFTDGRILMKGEPPANAKRVEDWEKRKPVNIDDIVHAPTEPAEFQHFAVSSPEYGKGISQRPVPHIEEYGEGQAIAVFKSGGKYFAYDQDRFNVMRNRYPDAEYGVKEDMGLLVAYMGQDNPVAAMMPVTLDQAEGPAMAEPPVDMTKPRPAAKTKEGHRIEEGVVTIETSIGPVRIPDADLTWEYGDDLETIFYYGNFQSDLPQPSLQRSLSVGDTVKYKDHTLMIMPQGWRDVTGLSDDAIEAIQTSENAIGLVASWRAAEKRLRQGKETGTEEPSEFVPPAKPKLSFEDLVPRPADVKHIKNVVVDTFRDWPQSIKKVGKDYWTEVMAVAKQLSTPYRYKALRQTMLGVFRHKKKPVPEIVGIEMQDVTDALTATHELSHNIDWLLNNKVFPSSIKGRFPDTTVGEMSLRNELKKISQILRPDMWESPKPYIKSHVELMADYISHYILEPEKTREFAPNLTRAFEAKLATKPELFNTISRLQESRYEGPVEPAVARHIREEFPVSKEFKPLQLAIDMTDKDYVKAAEELGITAARHYKLLIQRAQKEADRIDELIPNKARQTDLVVVAEKGSANPWTGKTREEIYKDVLTAGERKAITLFRAYQEKARQTVNKYLRGANIAEYIKFIEDYFIHAYQTPLTEKYKNAIARWAKRSPQAKKRVLPDLAKAVELGMKPRAKTLSEGLMLWAGINYRVMTNKAFLRILPQITNDDGVSILQKPQDYPNWPTVDYWPIRQNYAVPLSGRGVLLFQGRVAVDPRVKPFIDAMFGRKAFSTPVRIIEGLNAMWKAFELTLFSFFHHQAEFFSAAGSLGPRALPFVGGYYGKRAQAFGKKPRLWGFLPSHITTLKAGKELEKVPEFMDDYLAHGGQRGYISTEGINLMERMLKRAADYLEGLVQREPTTPLTGVFAAAYVPVKAAQEAYSFHQSVLWDNVNRAKLVSYYNIVADGAKHSNLPIKDVKEITVKYINDNFGGQEWLNTIFRNRKTRQFWTQLMMSLDWTWSQIKTARWPFGIGEKGKERRAFMRKIGRHHWFWYFSAIAGFTIAGSYAMSGKGPWENEKGHKLDIDWTKIWRSLPWNKDWKARGDYNRRYIGLGKAGRELVRWVTSPLKAFGYKLSPVARSTFEQTTGYNVGSNWAEPWAREDLQLYQEVYARFKHLMENFKPFAFSGNNAFLAFPSRKGMTQWKATRAYEDIYKARAKIAMGGIGGKIAKANQILRKNEQKLRVEIEEACKLNNVDASQADRAAMAGVRSKYYSLFWKATKMPEKKAVSLCNAYANALLELGVTPKGFKQSLRYRSQELPERSKEIGVQLFHDAAADE